MKEGIIHTGEYKYDNMGMRSLIVFLRTFGQYMIQYQREKVLVPEAISLFPMPQSIEAGEKERYVTVGTKKVPTKFNKQVNASV